MTLHTSQLDAFRDVVNRASGDVNHPDVTSKYPDFRIEFDAVVDQTISPFSEEYFRQQQTLYEEIAGRRLNQTDGELHLANPDELIASANPIGLTNVSHMAEYSRGFLAMLSLANLPPDAHVLDMGAGHGVSSELLGFCGCTVHAVDIDPVLGQVSRTRAAKRNYKLTRSDLNFDDVGSLAESGFSAAFFYQSLHHCLRPWELIGQLRSKLESDGLIAFAGEPIQTTWWSHWGLRLDPESVYVAREYGWFESGWSHRFISECFSKNGMQLLFFTGGINGSEIGIASTDTTQLSKVRARAKDIGLREITEPFGTGPERYLTQIGAPAEIMDRPGFRQTSEPNGMLMYGPYAQLTPGEYEISLFVTYAEGSRRNEWMKMDVVSNYGTVRHWEREIHPSRAAESEVVKFIFKLAQPVDGIEFRARVQGFRDWAVSIPAIRKIS